MRSTQGPPAVQSVFGVPVLCSCARHWQHHVLSHLVISLASHSGAPQALKLLSCLGRNLDAPQPAHFTG
eukprot:5182454-Alexandrium_andersonii.AAC.1